jgi:hypothetical protein
MLRSVFKERWECTHSFVGHSILQCKRPTALAQATSFNRPTPTLVHTTHTFLPAHAAHSHRTFSCGIRAAGWLLGLVQVREAQSTYAHTNSRSLAVLTFSWPRRDLMLSLYRCVFTFTSADIRSQDHRVRCCSASPEHLSDELARADRLAYKCTIALQSFRATSAAATELETLNDRHAHSPTRTHACTHTRTQ